MNFSPPSPESLAMKDDEAELLPPRQLKDAHDHCESSEDDGPLIARGRVFESPKEHNNNPTLREHCTPTENDLEPDDYTRNRPTLRQLSKPVPKNHHKHKKPGPRPWAAKPIMKNDLQAKKEVIREIESYWGKSFIKSYIPKCHRPLVKRGKGGKRSIYRDHETNPRNWLPSVLKSILMIAKLTDDKVWLKKAMNDVVRYRIKHTGNRKPQLVTTDFDVIEDMLVKQWKVSYAFEIRYKHLLVNRKDQEENDENIDHILQAGSGNDDSSDEDDDNGDGVKDESEISDQDLENGEYKRHDSVPKKYSQLSGYTSTLTHPPSAPPHQFSKQQKTRKDTLPQLKEPQFNQLRRIYDFRDQMPGYHAAMNHWGHPVPDYDRSDSYNGYKSYGVGYQNSYGPPPYSTKLCQGSQRPYVRDESQHPHSRHAMTMGPGIVNSKYDVQRFPPFAINRHTCGDYEPTTRLGMQGYPNSIHEGRTNIKHESPETDQHHEALDTFNAPTNEIGDLGDIDDDQAVIDAELEALKLELKLAKLKARQAALRQQNKAKKE
ncbi:hypothetical protein GQ44DRAFT_828555 [Phaeosphaeriaceae sp. PMI808]|nr:hypothetical protein GQ44DRAFT_828555 [Phaeosphaeriaceae sp. PMI808]